MENLLRQSLLLLQQMPLCDYCLGRQFSRLWPSLSNKEKGRAIKLTLFLSSVLNRDHETLVLLGSNGALDEAFEYLKTSATEVAKKTCGICFNKLSDEVFRKVAEKALEKSAGIEFDTFLVGAKALAESIEKEDGLRAVVGIGEGEDIRNDIKREVSKNISQLSGKKLDYLSPDVVITVDIFRDRIDVLPNPVFIQGRYLKHSREIPQSPWHCRKCWGRGCENCGYTGRKYLTSVAELVGEPAKTLFMAEDYKFHAAGREDVDALVEGEGRPFVLELKRPVRRKIPLSEVQSKINEHAKGLVTVFLEGFSTRKQVRLLKMASPITSKTYVLKAVYDFAIDESKLKEIMERFRDVTVEQLTPTRVVRRRGEKLRRKTVYQVEASLLDERTALFKISCQGGLYVKELVTGDNGRTRPSFADVIGAVPTQLELSVVKVET